MDQYAMYLRKSRADLEAEAHGEGETLARHEAALTRLAVRQGLDVVRIYREIVSGDTISARPEMQNLLSDVRAGRYAGVLTMEVERLARGNTIDQGVVAEAFSLSRTKIITPAKIYDPTNEFDMEYFEFGLFMARREYKTIVRRMQAGRAASAQEGLFPGGTAPYGYVKVKLPGRKGFTLEPHPDEAPVVRLIGELYAHDQIVDGKRVSMGCSRIARHLNSLGYLTRSGKPWSPYSVNAVLTNDANYGRVRWQYRKEVKSINSKGEIVVSRPLNRSGALSAKAIYEPLFSPQIQESIRLKKDSRAAPPTPWGRETQNPLAGLITCGLCGRAMLRLPSPRSNDSLVCHSLDCPCVSSLLSLVEAKTLDLLRSWLVHHELHIQSPETLSPHEPRMEAVKKAVTAADKALATLSHQQSRLQDLLEQGVYDAATYFERSRELAQRKSAKKEELSTLRAELDALTAAQEEETIFYPRVRTVLELYADAPNAAEKNRLLKSVLSKIVYTRTEGGRWAPSDNFSLVLYPRLASLRLLPISSED